jgi:hypothetical protein
MSARNIVEQILIILPEIRVAMQGFDFFIF